MPTLEPKPHEPRQERHAWDILPPRTVFALLADAAQADLAAQRLAKAGVSEDSIQISSGEEDARKLEEGAGGAQGLLSAVLHEITDQATLLEAYAQEMRRGRVLIAVRFEGEDKRQTEDNRATIEAILLDSGGARISYTSNWTHTEVVERGRGA